MDTAEEESNPAILSFPFGRVPDEWEVHTIPSGVSLLSSSHTTPENALEDSPPERSVQEAVLYKIKSENTPLQIKSEDSSEGRSLKGSTYFYNRAARIITTDDIRQADVRARVRQACGGLGGLLAPPPPLPKRSPTVARPPIRGRARASTTLARVSSPYERVGSSSARARSSSYTGGGLVSVSSVSTDRAPSPMIAPGAGDRLGSDRASSGSVSAESGSSSLLTNPRSPSRRSDCDKIVKEGQVKRVCWWEGKEVENVQLNEDGEPVALIPDRQSEFWKTLAEFPCHRPLPAMAEHELMRAYEEDKNVRALFEFVPEHREMFDELTVLRAMTFSDDAQQKRRDKIIAHHVAVLMEAACFLKMRTRPHGASVYSKTTSFDPFKMSNWHTTRRLLSVDEVLERATSVANLAMLRTYAEPSPVRIAAINEYTSLLESKLRSLLPHDASTRDRILAQLDIHRSVLAPIRRLPKELLIDILFRVANESPFRTLYVAVTLARVCAVWRAVAHGLSKLWSRLAVKSMGDFDQYCELFLPIPKKPHLPGLRCDDPALLKRLWDRIEPHACCWRSITLESQLSMLPDLQVLYMENLERLVIDAYGAPISLELSALDFVVASRLRHIGLTLDALQSERQLHVPVARSLTSLEITTDSPFPVTLALPLLQACADTLGRLILRIRHPLEGPEGSYPTSAAHTFEMKALAFLSLVDPACALLNHITAPIIKALILSNVPAYGSRSLLGFLTRSQDSPTLIDLRVYIPEERDPSAWIPCLRLMDKLRELHFDDMLSNAEFLSQMVLHPDKPSLLPSLGWLNIVKIYREHKGLHPARCHNTHNLSVDELLKRAATDANLEMLRTHAEPSRFQIAAINWTTTLLESKLELLPPDDCPTRAKILAQLDINRSILAPIRRLHVELLSYIFSLVVKESPLRTVNLAATLSRICVYWREVARGHAALWTTVVVDTPNEFDEYRELFLPLTKMMPLDLRCDRCDILQDLWDRIAHYASRWRRITLGARLSTLPDLKVLYMDRLERLSVFAYDAPLSTELSVLDVVVAPHLRHITLTLNELQSERQLHVPVTRELTSLVIEAMLPFPVTHVLPLLRTSADTLRSLTLKVRHPLGDTEDPHPTSMSDRFTLKALTFLSLVDPACALLNYITAPLVDVLILSNVPEYGTRALLGFLTRSHASRHLHTLRVYAVEEREVSAWIPCLQLLDNLTALHFDDLLSTREFLDRLSHHADKPLLLPSLQALALHGIFRKHPELHDDIARMGASRARPVQLSRGRIGYEIFGWIEESMDRGLYVM
ncbi:hypothetical protein GGF50DRAFT_113625 [Schizophyllum commune]